MVSPSASRTVTAFSAVGILYAYDGFDFVLIAAGHPVQGVIRLTTVQAASLISAARCVSSRATM